LTTQQKCCSINISTTNKLYAKTKEFNIERRTKQMNKERGITLIALIITIIILVILAAISLKIVFKDGIIDIATEGAINYATEQKKEEDVFNNSIEYINVATNKRPYIEMLKYSERTDSSMKITAMAKDEDGEPLTYKLYVGTSRDNLVEQMEIKENVEQGIEVVWIVPVVDSTTTYYYKVIVKDRYAEIDSGIKETNNAPVLGALTLTKDLDETTGNWVKVKTSATDKENDPITYTLKMWKKTDEVSEAELIAQTPTRTETKPNVASGGTVEIIITGLEEYQDYIYRVDVADENNMTIGTTAEVKTYCSGTGLECERRRSLQNVLRNNYSLTSYF